MHFQTFGLVHLLVSWVMLTISITLAALLVPGVSIRGGVISHLIVAAVFALVGWGVHAVVLVLAQTFGMAAQYGLGFCARTLVLALLLQITSMITPRLYVKTFVRALLMAVAVSFTTLAVEYVFVRAL